MRPATGWMAYSTLDALRLEQLGQVAHGVLRLGHGHAVARDDDDALDAVEQHGDLFGRGGLDRLVDLVGVRRVRRRPHRAEEHVGQRAVHRLAHDVGQDDARGADQRAGDDQHGVVDHEAGGRGGQARVGVQQGDHHRHVGAADGQRQQHAQHAAHADQHPEQQEVVRVQHDQHAQTASETTAANDLQGVHAREAVLLDQQDAADHQAARA